jgi:hypothetical protein
MFKYNYLCNKGGNDILLQIYTYAFLYNLSLLKKNTQSTSKLEHTCHWQFYPFSKNFSNFFMVYFFDSKLVSLKRKIVIKSQSKLFGSKSFIIIV